MEHWIYNSVFYHIYTLGFCGAPEKNDFTKKEENRLDKIIQWIPHLKDLGINALYLGPLFESYSHGYDTVDYYKVDRRLGTNKDLKTLVNLLHNNGIKVVLDGVFNHVSRDFFAFKDVIINKEASEYKEWFHIISFDEKSEYNDPFKYEGWEGHYNLVKLNLTNPDVKKHLLEAVKKWIFEFKIDGLRLDVAYCIDKDFLKELSSFCKTIKKDFWLMGEMIHGDYNEIANENTLDSATNYECYKGLYSSHNDNNYFEIAYSLNRLFNESGLYKKLFLYNFADNHDVDRIASRLDDPVNLFPLHCLLFTIPGIPSIYYGSEWGIKGKKTDGNDSQLRPSENFLNPSASQNNYDLMNTIKKLIFTRQKSSALKTGRYKEIFKNHNQFVFLRENHEESVIVAVNSSDKNEKIDLNIESGNKLIDLLNPGDTFYIKNGHIELNLYPKWARILKIEK